MSGHTPETWENPRFTSAPYSIWCGNTQIATTRWTQDDGSVSPECVQDDNEAKANASLIAAAPDHAAIARALCFGIARWEPLPSASHGEFCIGGMRHVTSLDEFGVPVMTSGMRAAIARIGGSK